MNARVFTFAIGAAVGIAVGLLLASPGDDDDAAGGQPVSKAQPPQVDLTSPQKKIAALEKEIEELKAQRSGDAGSSEPTEPNTVVKVFGDDGESQVVLSEVQQHMREVEAEKSAKRITAKLASLRRALDLNDEQDAQVRALLEREAVASGGLMSQLLSFATGVVAGEDAEDGAGAGDIGALIGGLEGGAAGRAADAEAFDFDAELLSLLDPEQASAYDEYRTNQRENQIQVSATQQLASLQSTVSDLTAEQKDEAFGEFARIAREEVEADGGASARGPGLRRLIRQRDAEQAALEQILTPDQFELYKSNNVRRTITIGSPGGAAIISREVQIETVDPPELQP